MPRTKKEETPIPEENKILYRSHLHEGYWFDLAKKIMDESEDNINNSAKNFEKLILWVWGVYTSIVGLGAGGFTAFLGKSISTLTLVGLILPSVILLLAYWLTTAASSSAIVEFEHRSPDSIRDAFLDGLKEKMFYYKSAKLAALIACFLIPLTIYIANRVPSGSLEILSQKKNGDRIDLMVSGMVPESKDFTLSIKEPVGYTPITKKTDSGHFAEKISIPSESSKVTIQLFWKDSEDKGQFIEKAVELK
ncbi:MAG: hypothetical protein KDK36_02775 [Leptospiraceae bacterium]|nr:hypothetical protein [Leptospiraceae bacterium]